MLTILLSVPLIVCKDPFFQDFDLDEKLGP